MSSLSFVSSSIVYYLVFKVQSGALLHLSHFFEMGQSVGLESLGAVCRLGHLRCPAPFFSSCCSSNLWWAQVDSNHRPHAYQACALTT